MSQIIFKHCAMFETGPTQTILKKHGRKEGKIKEIYYEHFGFAWCKQRPRIFNRFLMVFLCFVFALSACYVPILLPVVYAGVGSSANGEAIYTAANNQYYPEIVGDGGVGVLETEKSHKDPLLAWFLSFLIPGLGQHYNGQYMKGISQEVIFVCGILWAVEGSKLQGELPGEDLAEIMLGAGLALGAWVWSMVDAPISAININRERSWGRLSEFNNRNGLGLAVGLKKQGIKASLTLYF